jgi:nitroreductase
MNATIETILHRQSTRSFENTPVPPEVKSQILEGTLRAPTAGNLMLYTIIDVDDQEKKNTLARTCDNQHFIAKAPWVLLFLADYQRWHDYYLTCDVQQFCQRNDMVMRHPEEGVLMLACCDALIAAQTAVIAAESMGMGSCYIGDIMENCEVHQALFDLPRYTFPICLLCLGYPAPGNKFRKERFDRKFIVFKDSYKSLLAPDYEEMFSLEKEHLMRGQAQVQGATNVGQIVYRKKFSADYALEMNRSVRAMLRNWKAD